MTSPAGDATPAAEAAIDPELPICDPHHHMWVHRGRYLARDFLKEIADSGHNIVSTVFVACDAMYRETGPEELRPVGETEFVEREATGPDARSARTILAAGIVGYADLSLGEQVANVLEAHLAASPTRFRGIRFPLAWDPNPDVRGQHSREGWTQDARFRAAFAMLDKYRLGFDAWAFHPQLTEVADLARDFPGVTIVLNHAGGPLGIGPYKGRQQEVFATWSANMSALARHPNVYIKLGGMGMPRIGFPWNANATKPTSQEIAAALAPYFDFCIERFGPTRCMFESNFPSDKVSFPYGNIWNAYKRLARNYAAGERDLLFRTTALRAYRLTAD